MKRTLFIFALALALPGLAFGQAVHKQVYNDEDAAHASGDQGNMCLAVRNDTLAALAGTDGDYAALQVNDEGAVFVVGDQPEDSAHTSGDYGNMCLAVRNDALAALGGTDGDYVPIQANDEGALFVTGDQAEDAAHASGDYGLQSLAVRNDTLAALGGTDGDYAPLQVNAEGAVFVTGDQVEDTAHTDADYGIQVLAVRNDTLAALAGTDGDYAPLQVTDLGALLVRQGTGGIVCGQQDVAASGTAVQLGANACTEVTLCCETASTGDCFVDHETGNGTTGGMAIPDGSCVTLKVNNTNLLWLDASQNGDDVGWCCVQ